LTGPDVFALTGAAWWDAFLIGLAVAAAGAAVAAVVSLIRFIRNEDRHRMDLMHEEIDRGRRLEHRQNHVVRWARAVGRKVGIPFPLDDGDDDPNHWQDWNDWEDW
jgi:hypothetical protein